MSHSIEIDIQRAVNRLKNIVNGGTYLVTGATGMIGRYIVRMLLQLSDVKVIAACRSREKADQIFSRYAEEKDLLIVEFDVCKSEWPVEGDVDYIIHAAGICDNDFCEKYPEDVVRVNTLGVYEVLKFAEQKSSKKVVVFSSASVYGKSIKEKLSENEVGYVDFMNVHNSYAISKRAAENICQSYLLRMPLCIVRPFHIISPEMLWLRSSMIGEFYGKLRRGETISINGDGSSMRNFTYIVDVCEMVLLLAALCTGTYNIGNANGDLSVLQVLEIMKTVLKREGFIGQYESAIRFGRVTGKSSNANNIIPLVLSLQRVCEENGYTLKMSTPEAAFEKCFLYMDENSNGRGPEADVREGCRK